jgi:DNA-binding response OmpR family regulator
MTEPTHTILLAEEDPLSTSFEQLLCDGYEVVEADSRAKALAILGVRQPDLVLADVNGETLSLIDAVRQADGLASRIDPGTPMLVLAARAEELARVGYLERGSDDVLAKPYSYTELRARVRALLRRTNRIAGGRVFRLGAPAGRFGRARGVDGRRAGGADREGVRAAALPGGGADAGVDECEIWLAGGKAP